MHGTSEGLPLRDFFCQLGRATEVSKFDVTFNVKENVVTLNVSVDHMSIMQEL